MFPGKLVQIDARDLATAEPIRLCFRDEDILEVSPDTTVAHINFPMWRWGEFELPYN